jgi:plastocyanin
MNMQGRLTTVRWFASGGAALLLAAMVACGDSDGNGGNPGGPSGGGPGPSGATITIGANGAISPSTVTISVGQSVTFVNSHTGPHQIASDPHPAHTNCPSINALANIPAAQTRLTNAFTAAATCGFHDHNDPSNGSLQGTITVR